MPRSADAVLFCVDVGSTFTKAAAIDGVGRLVAASESPTTSTTDVLGGVDSAVEALGLGPVPDDDRLVCSSAGGGLRLAVVGQERIVSVEAGRRVALSAGARVVGTWAGPLGDEQLHALAGAAPDVVLLAGGTDGGNAEVLLHNATVIGRSALRVPVVVAGNAAVAGEAADSVRRGDRIVLVADNVIPRIGELAPDSARRGDRIVLVADNVIPRIGELAPDSARSIIRDVFIRHVIGGKHLSAGPRFTRLVRAATPDAVLTGVETLARMAQPVLPRGHEDVLVVDVGGATTDVFSVAGAEDGDLAVAEVAAVAPVVGSAPVARSVEGDLGVRWSARDLVDAAEREALGAITASLREAAQRRVEQVGLLPTTAAEAELDLELAGLAATIAVRRHARPGGGGRDLRRVGLAVGSGGVMRHAPAEQARAVLGEVLNDRGGGWALPADPRVVMDADYLLAPIGLLALAGRTDQAEHLASALLGAADR